MGITAVAQGVWEPLRRGARRAWQFLGHRRTRRIGAGLCVGGLGLVFLCSVLVSVRARGRIYALDEVPKRQVGVIFGSGVWPDGTLTAPLADRVDVGIALYRTGRVRKLLMSGDNSRPSYDEPTAMGRYAEARGVPKADIVLDYAGFRTYDTCQRAAKIFGIQSATLVTQNYHLPRSLLTCRAFGIDAVGVAADRQKYRRYAWYLLREQISRTAAVIEVYLFRHKPRYLGDPRPIEGGAG